MEQECIRDPESDLYEIGRGVEGHKRRLDYQVRN